MYQDCEGRSGGNARLVRETIQQQRVSGRRVEALMPPRLEVPPGSRLLGLRATSPLPVSPEIEPRDEWAFGGDAAVR